MQKDVKNHINDNQQKAAASTADPKNAANTPAQKNGQTAALSSFLPPSAGSLPGDKKLIISCFDEKKSWGRTMLIKECLRKSGVLPAARGKAGQDAVVQGKARLGTVITVMLENKDMTEETGGKLKLARDGSVILREDAAERYLWKILAGGKHTRKEIYAACESFFCTDGEQRNAEEDRLLRGTAGTVLGRMVHSGVAETHNGFYTLARNVRYPDASIGKYVADAEDGVELYANFLKIINTRGGEFFEMYAARLLSAYFTVSGYSVDNCTVVGGNDDGGVDIVLEVKDALGFAERVLVQAKARNTAAVTQKEVREFYGAMRAERGTRGVYITTSTFHSEAAKMIARLPDLAGIDNRKLFELAKSTLCGLKHPLDGVKDTSGSWVLDAEIFI